MTKYTCYSKTTEVLRNTRTATIDIPDNEEPVVIECDGHHFLIITKLRNETSEIPSELVKKFVEDVKAQNRTDWLENINSRL
jgi:hypothetical protein